MRNPYKVAREEFFPLWSFMGLRGRLYATRLVAGKMFWTAIWNWSRRMQEKVRKRRGPQEGANQ